MVTVRAPESEVLPLLVAGVEIAAVNGPESVVLAGDEHAVLALAQQWEHTRLKVSHAFHSAAMDPMLDEFRTVAASLTYHQPTIAMAGEVTSPEFWVRHVRETVRYDDRMRQLEANGVTTFLHVSPKGDVLDKVARAFVQGVDVDWATVCGGGHLVDLPTYPFERRRYWPSTPWLGDPVERADGDGIILRGRLSLASDPWLAGHEVQAIVLLPGTAYLELALRAAHAAGCDELVEMTALAPLTLTETGGVDVQVWVSGEDEHTGRRQLSVYGRADGADEWLLHIRGEVGHRVGPEPAELTEWPPRDAEPVEIDELYGAFAGVGVQYGSAFRSMRTAWRRGDELFAEVHLNEESPGSFFVHPGLFDSALNLMAVDGLDSPVLTFSWSGVSVHAAGAAALRVRAVRIRPEELRVTMADLSGRPVATVESLTLIKMTADRIRAMGAPEALSTVTWQPVELPATKADDVTVIHARWSEQVRDTLASPPDGTTLISTLGAIATGPDADVPDIDAATVWERVRAAQIEHPGKFMLVDHDGDDRLLGKVAATGLPQVIIRDGAAYAPKQQPVEELALPPDLWRLETSSDGTAESVRPVAYSAGQLHAGQVRVEVRAAALNFRDALMTLGMYAGEDRPLGGEFAGVVTEISAGVTNVEVGDHVMGVADGAFSPQVVADHRMVARIPRGWSFPQAAATPLAFLTAYHGLFDIAGLCAGESVLVHAAAGGVGMAAVQLARWCGATIYATASESKWDVVRASGVDHKRIASSRDTGFATKFDQVDVVLNSLAGEFVDASLGLLRDGGQFVEMGKADVRDPSHLERVHYQAIDLGAGDAGPDRIMELFATLTDLFEQGALSPLPVRCWDVRSASEAIRFVSQAKQTGKVVLTMPAPEPRGTILVSDDVGAELVRHLAARPGIHVVTATDGTLPDDLVGIVTADPEAAVKLHEATRDRDLSLFVLLSQGNPLFDGLALHRRANGLPAVSLTCTQPSTAVLDAAITSGQAVVVSTKQARRKTSTVNQATPTSQESFAQRLLALAPAEQHTTVLDVVVRHTATTLGFDSISAVEVTKAFRDLGFDSLSSVELRNRLATATGLRLPATLIFDHPTPLALAAHIHAELVPDTDVAPEVVAESTDEELAAASADELLDIIRAEFGKS